MKHSILGSAVAIFGFLQTSFSQVESSPIVGEYWIYSGYQTFHSCHNECLDWTSKNEIKIIDKSESGTSTILRTQNIINEEGRCPGQSAISGTHDTEYVSTDTLPNSHLKNWSSLSLFDAIIGGDFDSSIYIDTAIVLQGDTLIRYRVDYRTTGYPNGGSLSLDYAKKHELKKYSYVAAGITLVQTYDLVDHGISSIAIKRTRDENISHKKTTLFNILKENFGRNILGRIN